MQEYVNLKSISVLLTNYNCLQSYEANKHKKEDQLIYESMFAACKGEFEKALCYLHHGISHIYKRKYSSAIFTYNYALTFLDNLNLETPDYRLALYVVHWTRGYAYLKLEKYENALVDLDFVANYVDNNDFKEDINLSEFKRDFQLFHQYAHLLKAMHDLSFNAAKGFLLKLTDLCTDKDLNNIVMNMLIKFFHQTAALMIQQPNYPQQLIKAIQAGLIKSAIKNDPGLPKDHSAACNFYLSLFGTVSNINPEQINKLQLPNLLPTTIRSIRTALMIEFEFSSMSTNNILNTLHSKPTLASKRRIQIKEIKDKKDELTMQFHPLQWEEEQPSQATTSAQRPRLSS